MNPLSAEVRLLRDGVESRVRLVRGMAERATAGPLLVRVAVFASALVALLLAFPLAVTLDLPVLVLVAAAVLPAVAPRGAFVSAVLFTAVVGWLATTTAFGEQVTAWRLVALAGALYLTHSGAALAAVLPYDTVVAPGVLGRFAARAGLVVALTAGFALTALVAVEAAGSGESLAASLAGLGLVAGLAGLLSYLSRRRA